MTRRGADTDYDTYFTLIVQPHLARATSVFAGVTTPQGDPRATRGHVS